MKQESQIVEAEVTQEVPVEATLVKAKLVDDNSTISFGVQAGPQGAINDERNNIKKMENRIKKKMQEIKALREEIKKSKKRIVFYEKALNIQ